jgi:Flp pilus assembly protein TadD
MTERRLSWPLRATWAFVAVGTTAFAFGLLGSVTRQRELNARAKRIDVLVHQARWSVDHGSPAEALVALTELSGIEPNRPRLAYELGVMHRALGHREEAQRAFHRAVERAPGDAAAWSALAEAQRQAHDPEALISWRSALLLDPSLDAGVEVPIPPER